MALELTSSFEVIDPRFRKLALPVHPRREALHRLPLGRGAGVVRGRSLPGLVRHSERPHAALGRDRRLGLGVPPAGDEQQRPHRRSAGPARLVRAPQPLRVAHRVRRHAHRAGRSLRRQALQLAQRRGRQERRQHLVHRSELRHRLATTKATPRRARSAPATSIASTRRAAASPSSPPTSCSPTGSRSRPTNRCSTSSTPASRTWRTGRTTCGASRCRPTAARSPAARCSPPARWACTTAFASTCTATCGCRPATACTATRRDGSLLGKILIPESVANVCFGGPKLNRLFICGTTSTPGRDGRLGRRRCG